MAKKYDRRDGAEPLKDVFANMIDEMGLSAKIKDTQILDCIPELLGAAIDKKIIERYVYEKKLFIRTNSAPLRNELFLIKDALLQKMQNIVGDNVVNEIVVR